MIVTDDHENLCNFVETVLNGKTRGYDGKSKAIGIVKNGKIGGVFVFHNFKSNPDGSFYEVEISALCIDKSSVSRQYLRTVFQYPFIQLGLERVTAVCSAKDEGVISMIKKLGFTPEGLHRKGYFGECDSISFSMLKNECKWI